MTRIGFELEVSYGARSVLANLHRMGLTSHQYIHPYHCGCSDCDPFGLVEDGYLFKAQNDCTADGEFITGVLEYGTPQMDRAITGIGRALLMAGADTSGDVGNHVHVEFDQHEVDQGTQLRLLRLFGRYEDELNEIAAGPHHGVREYNGSMHMTNELWQHIDTFGTCMREEYDCSTREYRMVERPNNVYNYMGGGSSLCFKGETVEFRLWNATRAPWRIRTHVGLSVAMVHAAFDGADCTQDDMRCVEDVIGPYMDAPTWAGVLRQRFSKGGIQNAA